MVSASTDSEQMRDGPQSNHRSMVALEDLQSYFQENYVRDLTLGQIIGQIVLWVAFTGSGVCLVIALILYGATVNDMLMVSVVVIIPSTVALIIVDNYERKRKILKPIPSKISDADVDGCVLSLAKKFTARKEGVLFANYVYTPFTAPDNPKYFCRKQFDGRVDIYCKICNDNKKRSTRFTAQAIGIYSGVMTVHRAEIDIFTCSGFFSTQQIRLSRAEMISFGETFDGTFLQIDGEYLNLDAPFIGSANALVEEVKKYSLMNSRTQMKGYSDLQGEEG